MNEGDRLKRILVLCLVVLMMAGCAKEEKTVNRAVFALVFSESSKLREKVECGDSIMSRNMIGSLATLMEAKLQDF